MLIGKLEIRARIPHAGAMCLLDSVLIWDDNHIACTTGTHRAADNPLRRNGRLHTICGVEYAAQAMAVHGGLAGKTAGRPRAGYLASLRDVVCRGGRLDDLEGDLVVEAEQVAGDGAQVIYHFRLRVGTIEVLSGQALVVLDSSGTAG